MHLQQLWVYVQLHPPGFYSGSHPVPVQQKAKRARVRGSIPTEGILKLKTTALFTDTMCFR